LGLVWWQYVLIVLVLAAIAFAYLMYRGYRKVMPKPIPGIPYPAFTSVLGHAEKMIHSYKHEFRLHVMNTIGHQVHQLLVSTQSSVFVNDPAEVGRVIREIPTKGRIYSVFRYDQSIPDIMACDFESYTMRKSILGPSLESMKIPSNSRVMDDLMGVLQRYVANGKVCDVRELFTQFALDLVCEAAFGYKLEALHGSVDGSKFISSLRTMEAKRAGTGMFADPKARPVSPAELAAAQEDWRHLLRTLLTHIKATASASADPSSSVGAALLKLAADNQEDVGDAHLLCEIHQIVRHGHETIAGALCWLTYAIYRNRKVRDRLEAAAKEHSESGLQDKPYPAYLENTIKELLRRYPVAGNMTVRTPHSTPFDLAGGAYTVPAATPIFLHMFSHHNSSRHWTKPKEFLPERWSGDAVPSCPFMARSSSTAATVDDGYSGLGFETGSLSYFPFSAGERGCAGKGLALAVLRDYLLRLAGQGIRMTPSQVLLEEDAGASLDVTLIPQDARAMQVLVKQVRGVDGEKTTVVEEEDDGWAADEDEEIVAAEEGEEEDKDE